ncbi:MAG: threonine-phosphate decarboxylase CobD [Lachnospiraceae bacterium]|nr:threonine-phosphate decarboxylase CobD [Robinsoniella sp.]MDY3767312.1 threonine-phosphate decarboxylase CobD [Lachnospiraceae bacterium]
MQMHKHGGDIYTGAYQIDFSANINPFGMPDSVREAACAGVLASVNYPDVSCRELRQKTAKKHHIPEEYLIFGNGAAELIFAVTAAIRPKKALVIAPGFAEYEQAMKAFGCEVEYYFLDEERQFQIRPSYLERIHCDIDLVFLCNPNNPTGQLIEPEFLLQVIERCRECQTLLVLDECFNEFLDQPHHYTMLPRVKEFGNLMILKAFTKIYAMPGLRLGYAICSNQMLIGKMREMLQPWNVSIPAQMAGIAALDEEEFVEKTRSFISQERVWMKQEMTRIGMQIFGSYANYIFFKGPKDLASHCREKGILIRDCSNYAGLVQGYYRVAVRTHEENRKLISCIEEAVKGQR